MTEPSLAIQDAIETLLRADADLIAAMGGRVRIYTEAAPHDTAFPYILLGEDQVIDDGTECADSVEVVVTIHVWAREKSSVGASRRQAKTLAGLIRSALKAPLGVTDFDVVSQEFETCRHLTDPDGRTAHSVESHRFLLDPA